MSLKHRTLIAGLAVISLLVSLMACAPPTLTEQESASGEQARPQPSSQEVTPGPSAHPMAQPAAEPAPPEQKPALSLKGQLELPFEKYNLQVKDGFAFLLGRQKLLVIDARQPERPQQVAELDNLGHYVNSLALSDNRLFLIEMSSSMSIQNLKVIDISDPETPRISQTLNLTDVFGNRSYDSVFAYQMQVKDGQVYISATRPYEMDASYLLALDPGQPEKHQLIEVLGEAIDLAVSDAQIYIACGDHGVQVISRQNPHALKDLGKLNLEGYTQKVAYHQNRLFALSNRLGLSVAETTSSDLPNLRLQHPAEGEFDSLDIAPDGSIYLGFRAGYVSPAGSALSLDNPDSGLLKLAPANDLSSIQTIAHHSVTGEITHIMAQNGLIFQVTQLETQAGRSTFSIFEDLKK